MASSSSKNNHHRQQARHRTGDQRSGKQPSAHGSVAHTVAKTNEELRNELAISPTIKLEEPKMDEDQINRLANGVTQDVAADEVPFLKLCLEAEDLTSVAMFRNHQQKNQQ